MQDIIQTCTTFQYLNFIHLHSLTSKGSTLSFYQTMDLALPIWQYPALKLMLNQWRHLHMLKQGGRVHDPNPRCIKETKAAELAIKCPSCPRPGINLPKIYLNAPPEDQFLDRSMLAMDANFHLKNQLILSWTRDLGMGVRSAYFVEKAGYEKYVKSRMITIYVGFAALAKAATKYISCTRMDVITAVGNLEKGERYNIACQWFPLHGQKDHQEYSFNIIPGVGSTDGEGLERIWAAHNPLATSTKPMAPATRLLVLDDNFGFWNWLKYTGHALGISLEDDQYVFSFYLTNSKY
ncbi:hypothetical protein BT96DRAFT_954569 [Gymnopus androsaceus JB14]|uniref:CxC2-like cysteine cluster KDZ transposase-associated domain-containing protein n=1 Tax=Gymnopus androsaceus JB14 TaxID=1447944 RepID=A0A6A4IAX3_9AGAR|nr:hypothetical protein BT96DRAFT_954569 [Gymnopus androsaceus JB14]